MSRKQAKQGIVLGYKSANGNITSKKKKTSTHELRVHGIDFVEQGVAEICRLRLSSRKLKK